MHRIDDAIGNTPLIELKYFSGKAGCRILGKFEAMNPSGSVKARLALGLIQDAESRGVLHSGTVVIEATSGNTGIGLAMICAARGYRLILTMPENMSGERRVLLAAMGAELVLTPASEGMAGAAARVRELCADLPNVWMADQFANPANAAFHECTTAVEILNDTDGQVEVFVAGIGTGGTITGVGRALKKYNPSVYVIGVEPSTSAVLSGKLPGPHAIQGIGAGFIPKVLDMSIIDEIIPVDDIQAKIITRDLAAKEGLFCGISSGAALYAALQAGRHMQNQEKKIVVMLPDGGDRYLSTNLWDVSE
ncbi:cysteine synthase A [bacterium]|nr:cysteine synthase A [bacterium]